MLNSFVIEKNLLRKVQILHKYSNVLKSRRHILTRIKCASKYTLFKYTKNSIYFSQSSYTYCTVVYVFRKKLFDCSKIYLRYTNLFHFQTLVFIQFPLLLDPYKTHTSANIFSTLIGPIINIEKSSIGMMAFVHRRLILPKPFGEITEK